MEEKRPMDLTRRLLRVFGVKVTEYEERTAALLERVRQRPLQVLDQSLEASLSIGIATAEGCGSLEELLAKADAALYRAKKEGRARVCIAA